jgi:hypothetical protein
MACAAKMDGFSLATDQLTVRVSNINDNVNSRYKDIWKRLDILDSHAAKDLGVAEMITTAND